MSSKVGKIIKREPVMDGDDQAFFENDHGKFFKFEVTMSDGKETIKGQCNGKDKDPFWKEGMVFTYDCTESEYKGEKQYKFSSFKKAEPDVAKDIHIKTSHDGVPAKEFKSSYNDPVSTARLAMDKAIELAVKYLKLIQYPPESQIATFNPEMIMSVADKFYDWTIKDVADKDSFWLRRGALLNAMDSIDWLVMFYPDPAEKLIIKLFRLAEFYLIAPMSITKESMEADKKPQ